MKNEPGKYYVAKEVVGDPGLCKKTFLPEQQALAVLDHPNIVKMKESFGQGESGSVIIIDFLKGSDMNVYMTKNYFDKGITVPNNVVIGWI